MSKLIKINKNKEKTMKNIDLEKESKLNKMVDNAQVKIEEEVKN